MTVEQKMDAVVKDLLGSEYSMKLLDDHNYEIYKNTERHYKVQVKKSVKSHWKELLTNTMNHIYSLKIKISLSKIK